MFNKINIVLIIKSHIRTLRDINEPDGNLYWRDVVTYFILPIVVAFLLSFKKIDLSQQVSNLIAIISIFGGFLFNLLAIIYTYLDKVRQLGSPIKKRFAGEINSNISFCIVLSIFSVLLLLLYGFIPIDVLKDNQYFIKQILLFVIYCLLTLFFLSLLMVLTRVFILLQKED